ncbi:MAG TPA: FAD-binding protein [Ktedonobacteraceae bacterium]|nr:FAD-binding protein [Ktedonobacteraceae bacterium]
MHTEQAGIGPLKIIVCIKQVPLLSALRFDQETRRLVREGVPLELNELDVYALTEAVRLRTLHGGEVIAITMGPPQAHEALATALAIGANRAIHLSDRAFGGADTAATAFTLSLAIAPEHPDLIFCGRHSIDAETSQVGPEIAEMLALPQISAIQKIDLHKVNGRIEVIATRETDEGSETLSVPIPALVTAAERLNDGIWPDEHAIREASHQSEQYQLVTAADLNVDSNLLGQKGSPTWVTDVEPDTHTREARVLTGEDPLKLVELLVNDLQTHGFLDLEKLEQSRTHRHSPSSQRLGDPIPGKAVWVVAELSSHGIRSVTLELLGKGIELAAKLQGELAALLIGGTTDISDHAATLAAYGAERVYVAADSALEHYTTDGYCAVLSAAILTYQPAVVLLGSTANGRDLAPRVAARLKLGLTGDCIDLSIDDQQRLVQYKPAFGNQVISLILSNTLPAMTTLRPGMLHAAEADFSRVPVIEQIPALNITSQIHTHIINSEYRDVGVEELESAQIILGIGIGMGEPEHYSQVYKLAALLNAAIGATRNVTDKGWLPKQTQIGLTGRAVAPQLYLALGIRGAAEHIAGIRKANYIVSINKNRRAAIFRHSDLGVIADVHILLPLLIEYLEYRINTQKASN